MNLFIRCWAATCFPAHGNSRRMQYVSPSLPARTWANRGNRGTTGLSPLPESRRRQGAPAGPHKGKRDSPRSAGRRDQAGVGPKINTLQRVALSIFGKAGGRIDVGPTIYDGHLPPAYSPGEAVSGFSTVARMVENFAVGRHGGQSECPELAGSGPLRPRRLGPRPGHGRSDSCDGSSVRFLRPWPSRLGADE
jgi:hypothetical protein